MEVFTWQTSFFFLSLGVLLQGILKAENQNVSRVKVVSKLIANFKTQLKTEHLPIALVDSLKLGLFVLSPIYIENSTLWIFLANTEVIVSYIFVHGAQINHKSARGLGIVAIVLCSVLSLVVNGLGSLLVLGYVGVLIFSRYLWN